MSIAWLYEGREIFCDGCHEWTDPDDWEEGMGDEIEHECGWVNGPLSAPPQSRPKATAA